MASTYLTRTPSSSGNLKTWTFSAWFKKGSGGYLFGAGDMSDGDPSVAIEVGTTIEFRVYGGGHISRLVPTQVTRDNSAWYHYVVAVDTTQGTASNRVKVYINGTQVTSFSTEEYMSQNYDTMVNSSSYAQRVGDRGGENFDGCMAHVHLIDGTAYPASTFGETDATTGIWKPKTAPSVTYGTNGFFLKFENSADMDFDSSPNNLTFTTSGTLTQTVDTPSNVFATLNPLQQNNTATTYSNGNTKGTGTSSVTNFSSTPATLGASSGKFYAEYKPNLSSTSSSISGFVNLDTANFNVTDFYGGSNNMSAGLYDNSGQILYSTGTNLGSVGALSNGDIVMLAMDLDNGYLYWGKNGTWFNSADPTSASGTGGLAISNLGSNGTYTFLNSNRESMGTEWNFGNGYFGTTAVVSAGSNGNGSIFEFNCPSGYYALNTKNINTYG
jgi:hypothetical protein